MFEPGSLAVVVRPAPECFVGQIVTVIGPPVRAYPMSGPLESRFTKELVYPVDIELPEALRKELSSGDMKGFAAFRANELRPYKDDGDSRKTATWDEDLFVPKALKKETADES